MLVGPGAHLPHPPLMEYSQADVDEALKQNLLKNSTWNVTQNANPKSWSFEMFVVA